MSDPSQYTGYATGSGPGRVGAAHERGASTALVLGILSLFCFGIVLGPAAVVVGLKARERIRASHGALEGEGMARAGVMLGAVGTLGAIVILVLFSTGAIRFG